MASHARASEVEMPSSSERGHPTVRRRQRLTHTHLKALYELGGATRGVNTSPLAGRLRVSVASATEMLGRLDALGVVRHNRYRGAVLTAGGRAVALEMIRHHRLLATFLVEKLGYRGDEVHEEAERLEHVMSQRMEQRMLEALRHPAIDCHCDPIPDLAGVVAASGYFSLTHARAGERVIVRRVSGRDPGVLRVAHRLGLRLGARLEVLAESAYEAPISIRVRGRRKLVPIGIARAVLVG